MTKKIIIAVIILSAVVLFVIKGLSFLRKVEVNTVDPQASSDIEGSKKDGLFLKEYEANEVAGNFFQVKEAWVEYTWKNGFEGDRVVKAKTGRMQLNLKLTNFLDSSIKNDRYMIDWKMKDIVNGSVWKANAYTIFIKNSELPDSFNIILNRVKHNITAEEIGRFTVKKK